MRYAEEGELLASLESLDPALTFTLLVEEGDPYGPPLLDVGRHKAGRVIVNGVPTGVGVSWSMQHGGPLPAATSSLHTSVGATSLRRWLRPVSYQSVPDEWLPASLREDNPLAIPRRVDGVLVLLVVVRRASITFSAVTARGPSYDRNSSTTGMTRLVFSSYSAKP